MWQLAHVCGHSCWAPERVYQFVACNEVLFCQTQFYPVSDTLASTAVCPADDLKRLISADLSVSLLRCSLAFARRRPFRVR
jgi:hypothetical protein